MNMFILSTLPVRNETGHFIVSSHENAYILIHHIMNSHFTISIPFFQIT